MDICSPHKPNTFTCFSLEDLRNITKSFNKHSDLKMKSSLNKKELYNQLKENFKKQFNCDKETCWVNKKIISGLDTDSRKRVSVLTFKPIKPKERYFLLNTHDINIILLQYELVYPNFRFAGALPSDTFNDPFFLYKFKDLLKNYNFTGLIFNLDPSYLPGSHWVALFFNNKKKTIEYFDSTGEPPNKNIQKFLDTFKESKLIVNNLEHQRGITACGLYSILFILYKLENTKNFDYLKNRLPDSTVNKFRSKLFRNSV